MTTEVTSGENSTKPASFSGKLNLSVFEFTSSGSGPPRRSVRLSSSTSGGPSPAPSVPATLLPSRPIIKRKSPHPEPTSKKANASTPSPAKRPKLPKKASSGYAPPSTYAHLPLLPDVIGPNLLVLFIGLNPGVQTARTGHAYAHPSNLFWKLLYSSGVTPRRCFPSEDSKMAELFNLGLTNIVARPSRNGAELSKQEMDEGVAILEEKVRKYRPESICLVGKSIWESFWRVRKGRALKKDEFTYGWQDQKERFGGIEGEWEGSRVFVATSTSGLAATMRPAEKEAVWKELGSWVESRREQRKAGEKEDGEKEDGEREDGVNGE